ncbi:hypothetical protein JQX13_25890 [Archangium violaceum]|nr:hypothetical protein [Archangium violaceum]QRK13156.1 hypothetical protein JQX13_25890 [Archangium violaceum]
MALFWLGTYPPLELRAGARYCIELPDGVIREGTLTPGRPNEQEKI